jgi:hypothetical protein
VKDLWQKHEKDAVSVRMWKDKNPAWMFYYQEHGLLNLNDTVQDNTAFTLEIQTDWQFQQMLKHGNGSVLSMDSTFSTTEIEIYFNSSSKKPNFYFRMYWFALSSIFDPSLLTFLSLQYPLYTLMVFDEWRNGIPVAFFVISSAKEKDLFPVLWSLREKVHKVCPSWEPSAFIVNNAQAEINVLRWPTFLNFLYPVPLLTWSPACKEIVLIATMICAGWSGHSRR